MWLKEARMFRPRATSRKILVLLALGLATALTIAIAGALVEQTLTTSRPESNEIICSVNGRPASVFWRSGPAWRYWFASAFPSRFVVLRDDTVQLAKAGQRPIERP